MKASHYPPSSIPGNLMTTQHDIAVLQRQVHMLAMLCLLFAQRIADLETEREQALLTAMLEEILQIGYSRL